MAKIYFIYDSYVPNNASNNRSLAYMKAFSSMRKSINVIYLMPDSRLSRMEEHLLGVEVYYFWNRYFLNFRFFKYILYIYNLYKIYCTVKKDDIVYLYGGIDLLALFSHKKGVHVFHERTEHPLVSNNRGRLLKPSIEKYMNYCKRIDGLFVISTLLRDFFIENGVDSQKIVIVNSIVDSSRFKNIKKSTNVRYFAYCGNGDNRKDRVNDLIKVFSNISEKYTDVKLLIIGPLKQPHQEEQDNVQLVKNLGLSNRIIFTGVKTAKEIPQLLVDATALFLTRPDTLENRAGFSTKLSEYLATGNPVVAASVGDIPLYLKDKVNALIYKPEDLSALKAAMEYILDHPVECQKIGLAGQEVADTFFNAQTETKKLITAFDKVSKSN